MTCTKHAERFLDWEDHSKPIVCAICEIYRLREELETAQGMIRLLNSTLEDQRLALRGRDRLQQEVERLRGERTVASLEAATTLLHEMRLMLATACDAYDCGPQQDSSKPFHCVWLTQAWFRRAEVISGDTSPYKRTD